MDDITKRRTILLIVIIISLVLLYDYGLLTHKLLEWNKVYILEDKEYTSKMSIQVWHLLTLLFITFIIIYFIIKHKRKTRLEFM